MDEASIVAYLESFAGVQVDHTEDTSFYSYNPDRRLRENHPYFATFKRGDDVYDTFSALDREGAFRLNLGVGKATFQALFGDAEASWDFTRADVLMPHPVYAKQYWVCVVNPSAATFVGLHGHIAEAYALAVAQLDKRLARQDRAEATPNEPEQT